jgi:hypothetical protein
VSAPLDFLKIFAGQLRAADISFAITSGMACVHYGLQQNTKDSDWIIPAEDLEKLRTLLSRLEGELPPWRVSYRQIFGAPLEADYMQHGWTSHLSIWDGAGSVEHKVDIFSKPPRVKPEEIETDAEGWLGRHGVAQMKRTDRDKDWPIVQGLGKQLWERNQPFSLLHLMDGDALRSAWQSTSPQAREDLSVRRPLLRSLSATPAPDSLVLERLFAVKRAIWERVNAQRHTRYNRAWKDFYRQWRREADWEWPTEEAWWLQHRRAHEAAQKHGLPPDPLAGLDRLDLVKAALTEVAVVTAATENEIAQVLPPVDELLP